MIWASRQRSVSGHEGYQDTILDLLVLLIHQLSMPVHFSMATTVGFEIDDFRNDIDRVARKEGL
jgi:hypothetical protein